MKRVSNLDSSIKTKPVASSAGKIGTTDKGVSPTKTTKTPPLKSPASESPIKKTSLKTTAPKTESPIKKTSEVVSTKNVSPAKTNSPPKVGGAKISPKSTASKTDSANEKIRTISAPTARKSSVDIPTQRKASLDAPSLQKITPSTSKISPNKISTVAPTKSSSPKIGGALSPSKKLAPVKITPEKSVPNAKNDALKSPKILVKTVSPLKTDKPVSPTLKKAATLPTKTVSAKSSPRLGSTSKISPTSKSLFADPGSKSELTRKASVESVLTRKPSVESVVTRKASVESVLTRKPSVESVATRKASVESGLTRKASVESILTRKPSVESVLTRKPSCESVLSRKASVDLKAKTPKISPTKSIKASSVKPSAGSKVLKSNTALPEKKVSLKDVLCDKSGSKVESSFAESTSKNETQVTISAQNDSQNVGHIRGNVESSEENVQNVENGDTILRVVSVESQPIILTYDELERETFKNSESSESHRVSRDAPKELNADASESSEMESLNIKSSDISLLGAEEDLSQRSDSNFYDSHCGQTIENVSGNDRNIGEVSECLASHDLNPCADLRDACAHVLAPNIEVRSLGHYEKTSEDAENKENIDVLESDVGAAYRDNVQDVENPDVLVSNVGVESLEYCENVQDVENPDVLVSDASVESLEYCDNVQDVENPDVLVSDFGVESLEYCDNVQYVEKSDVLALDASVESLEYCDNVQDVENPDVLASETGFESLEYCDNVQDVENPDVLSSETGVESLEYCDNVQDVENPDIANVHMVTNTDVSVCDVEIESLKSDETKVENFEYVNVLVSDVGKGTLDYHESPPVNFQGIFNPRVLLPDVGKESNDLTGYDVIGKENDEFALRDICDNFTKHNSDDFSVSGDALLSEDICHSQDAKMVSQLIAIDEENLENYSKNSNFEKKTNRGDLTTLATDDSDLKTPTSDFVARIKSGSEILGSDEGVGIETFPKSLDEETHNSEGKEIVENLDDKQKPKSKKSKPKLQPLSSLEAYNLLVQKYGDGDFIEKRVEKSETGEETCKIMATFGMYKTLRANDEFLANRDNVARFKTQIQESYAKIYTENGPSYAEIVRKMPPKCFEIFQNGATAIDILNMMRNIQFSISQTDEVGENKMKICEEINELRREDDVENSANQVQSTKNIRKKRGNDDFKLVCRKKFSKDTSHAYLKDVTQMEKNTKVQNWNVERYAPTQKMEISQYSRDLENDEYFYEDTHFKSSKYKIRKMRYDVASQDVRRYGNDYYTKMKNVIYMSPVWRSFY